MADRSCVYGLKHTARALCAVENDTENNSFLVGTMSLKRENEVHLLEFNEEDFEITSQIYRHPQGEIWSITSSPVKPDHFFTVYNIVDDNGVETKASLWKMGSDSGERNKSGLPLQQVVTLPDHTERIQGVFWEPGEKSTRVISLDESNIRIWNLDSKLSVRAADSITVGEKKGTAKLRTMSFNPHSVHSIATANDCGLKGWDLRTLRPTFSIEQCHSLSVRDLDFNPNKNYQLASCGDDCLIKIWDTRHIQSPVKTIASHSHWVWRVAYNQSHDQLILSSSSDNHVNLENIVSVSSLGSIIHEKEKDEDPAEKQVDGLIATYDQHEDSVYAIAWSNADPWIFASMSYDGRVVIDLVPRDEKYKIIL